MRDAEHGHWLEFQRPRAAFVAHNLEQVLPVLREVVRLARERRWYAAGFVGYEAAPAFDFAHETHPPDDFPLAWFGLYQRVAAWQPPTPGGVPLLRRDWQLFPDQADYRRGFEQIRRHLRDGDSYQVNYTARLRCQPAGKADELFASLLADAPYGAWLDFPDFALCSASPELFFQLRGDQVRVRPMKGTRARLPRLTPDLEAAAELRASAKERAENLMIVDMLRNDLGRVALPGSVRVTDLFRLEKYPTVWQMTSSVEARCRGDFLELFRALFPCASITGAPKAQTMRIIRQVEPEPRRIYTGTIGFLRPDGSAQFNVAIRTLLLDKQRDLLEYGTGGGIVWDSRPEEEYRECLAKTRILQREHPPDFSLLETLRWHPCRGYFLLEAHLRRLMESAAYFDYPCDPDRIRQRLVRLAADFPPSGQKIRLLLDRRGEYRVEHSALPDGNPKTPLLAAPAREAVDPENVFLYHKTTERRVYEQARATDPAAEEVILWNNRGELTETRIANLVVYLDGQWLTPPTDCGLLDGTYRRHLLQRGLIREQVIPVEKLGTCRAVFAINSVRGWRQYLLPSPAC